MENKPAPKVNHLSIRQTILLTLLALIGFIAGTLLTLHGENIFHEMDYKPATVIDTILYNYENKKCPLPATRDTCEKSDTIIAELSYRRDLLARLSDSAREKALFHQQLFINNDSFDNACLINFKYTDSLGTYRLIKWDYYINYSFKYNKPIPPYHLSGWVPSSITSYTLTMDFFTAYPGFAMWAILIILQFSLFLVLPVIVIMVIKNFKTRLPAIYKPTGHKLVSIKWGKMIGVRLLKISVPTGHKWLTAKFAVLSSVMILVFLIASFFAFFHPNLINSGLFYKRMDLILGIVAGLAAVSGVCCFTGFMLISGTPCTDEDESVVTDADVSLFNEMNALFTNLLIVSTIILCIVVLATGTLYTSINDLEFIEKITEDMGFSPFAYHYVLLIAILCTGLLLFFFIPAKLRLIDMEKRIRSINPKDERLGKPADIFGIIKSVFVVGLPIITGIVHFLLNILSNG